MSEKRPPGEDQALQSDNLAPATSTSRTLAIAAMCAGVLLLAVSDALTKWLGARYGPLQITFARNIVALPLVVGLVLWADGRAGLRSARPMVHLGRGLVSLLAIVAYIASLRTLPLAEAAAIIAAAPVLVAALAGSLLGERVGPGRWAAILAGLGGVLVVTQPGAAAFQPASLLALAGTALYALLMVSARWIDPRDGARTVMLYITGMMAALSAPALLLPWPEPRASDADLFFAMAVVGTLGVTLLTQAFRMAPAAVVAPFDYTALLWAGLLGWIVWGEAPGWATWAGGAVIVASGLWLVLGDRGAGHGEEGRTHAEDR